MSKFFSMDIDSPLSTFSVRSDEFFKDNGIDHYINLVKGNLSDVDLPVVFRQTDGTKFFDFITTRTGIYYLMTEILFNKMIDSGIKGLVHLPIKLFDKNQNLVNGYTGLSITGRCGAIDYTKSKIIEKKTVPNGPSSRYYIGLYFDESSWDGSDIFISEETVMVICTSKVKDLFKALKIKHVRFTSCDEFETWERALPKDKRLE